MIKLPTCEVTVRLDEGGHATYLIPQPVSWDNIQIETALVDAAKRTSAIVYGSLACRDVITRETLLNLMGKTTALKIFDVNLRPPHYTLPTIENIACRGERGKDE